MANPPENRRHTVDAPPEEMLNRQYNPSEQDGPQKLGGDVPTGTSGMRPARPDEKGSDVRPMIEWGGGGT